MGNGEPLLGDREPLNDQKVGGSVRASSYVQ